MSFVQWLESISRSGAAVGEPFQASWAYVAVALLLPLFMGAVYAGLIRLVEKAWGIRLGGGGA